MGYQPTDKRIVREILSTLNTNTPKEMRPIREGVEVEISILYFWYILVITVGISLYFTVRYLN